MRLPASSLLSFMAAMVVAAAEEHQPTWQSASPVTHQLYRYQPDGGPYTVVADQRSLLINGTRVPLLCGAVHYARATRYMWPLLMQEAIANGLNCISTSVFWNMHEYTADSFDWAGRCDIKQFLDDAKNAGLYVYIRVGPYIGAQFDYGGLPVWLNQIPSMELRTVTAPWQTAATRWLDTLIGHIREYFADRGGPIVLAQLEERIRGDQAYADWLGTLITRFNVSIPWTMADGNSADGTTNTCNSCDCYQTYAHMHTSSFPFQPLMQSENWSGYQVWGQATGWRTVNSIAASLAKWFAVGGSVHSYEMWFGGNNYDITMASGMTTMHSFDTVLSSSGLRNDPKFSHLAMLHQLLWSYGQVLLSQHPPARIQLPHWNGTAYDPNSRIFLFIFSNLSRTIEFVVNEDPLVGRNVLYCNNHTVAANAVHIFDGQCDLLFASDAPPAALQKQRKSISRMQDGAPLTRAEEHNRFCANHAPLPEADPDKLIYMATTQPSHRVGALLDDDGRYICAQYHSVEFPTRNWTSWPEPLGSLNPVDPSGKPYPSLSSPVPYEQLNITADDTEYLYYRTKVDVPIHIRKQNHTLTLDVTLASALLVYWDGKLVGIWQNYEHGAGLTTAVIPFTEEPDYTSRTHILEILSVSLGIDDSGQALASKGLIGNVMFDNVSLVDGTSEWVQQPYTAGELLSVYSSLGSSLVSWEPVEAGVNKSAVWFQAEFELTPAAVNLGPGSGTVVLNLLGLGRGHVYVNGNDVGRYNLIEGACWGVVSCCTFDPTSCHQPSQQFYHVPSDWLQASKNVITIFEETGAAHPTQVQIQVQTLVVA